MNRTILQSLERFAALTSRSCGTCGSLNSRPKMAKFDVSLHSHWKTLSSRSTMYRHHQLNSCARFCTAAECHEHDNVYDSDSEEHIIKTKRGPSGGKKKRRLRAEGSILTDPGVPVPKEMQRDELIKCLAKSAVVQDDIITFNKPASLAVSGGQLDPDEVTFLKLLPEVAEAIGYPSAEVVHGPERESSGLLLLGHDKASAQKLSDAYTAAKNSKKLIRKYWAVTVGIPSPEQGIISEPIGYDRIGDQLMAVIRHDPTKASFQRIKSSGKKQVANRKAETHYQVLSSNEQLKCALVELQLNSFTKNQLQVHMTYRRHPILGDHIYSSRIRQLMGVPVHLDPHEALPATQDVGPVLKQALLIRSGLLHMLPLHLHWHEITLPKWKKKKDVCIRVPLPDYFWKTLQLLKLSPPLLEE